MNVTHILRLRRWFTVSRCYGQSWPNTFECRWKSNMGIWIWNILRDICNRYIRIGYIIQSGMNKVEKSFYFHCHVGDISDLVCKKFSMLEIGFRFLGCSTQIIRNSKCWWLVSIRHKYLKLVSNTIRHQFLSPTSI